MTRKTIFFKLEDAAAATTLAVVESEAQRRGFLRIVLRPIDRHGELLDHQLIVNAEAPASCGAECQRRTERDGFHYHEWRRDTFGSYAHGCLSRSEAIALLVKEKVRP